MRKLLNLSKTLLVAAGLCVGASNAWADLVPTTESCNFENSETLFTASGRMTGANAADPSNANNHVYSFTSASNAGNGNNGGFAYYNFSALSATAAKVDISFDCYIPQVSGQLKISFGDASVRTLSIFGKGAWGYNNSGAIFAFGTERGKLDGNNNENYAKVNDTNIGSTTTLKATDVLGLWVSVSSTVDITNKKVSYTIKNKSTDAELVKVTDAAFFSDAANKCTQLDIQTGVNSVTAYVDNVSITSYVDESEKYANYTIKYKYGETEIKDSRIVENIKVDNDATITESDKANIWYNEEKYIYASDDAEGKTVAEDGSTVVTVTFRKATVEAYTVNLINSANNEILVENAYSGNVIEGESSAVYYHKAIKVGGVWYVRTQNGSEPYYGINAVAGTNTVSYTENSGISYFFEVEDLPVVQGGTYGGWRNDGMAIRSSGGEAPRHFAKNYAYTEALGGGIYELAMNARNQSSSATANITLAYMDENDNIVVLDNQFEEWAKGATAEKTVSVSIPGGARFVLYQNDGNNNSNLNMDFLMFTRTGDYTVSKTITSAGWATYCSPYALDFTNSIENLTAAYLVTGGKDGKVTLSKPIKTTVPANTGLLLKGSGECVIPIAASGSTDVSSNLLQGVTANTEKDAETIYVLMNDADNGVGFYKNTQAFTVGANTAYLNVSDMPDPPTARAFFGIFSDEASGIRSIENTVINGQDVYNLSGQRISKPTKGLFIVNGKKVIMK